MYVVASLKRLAVKEDRRPVFKLIDGARNYVVIHSDHVTTYPPQKAAREIVCAAPDKCI
jgi:hypothetical protein